MATLIFEYNVVPYFPILSPLKRIPDLERKLYFLYEQGVTIKK